ncbi:alpha/beta fold hydrolase [Marinobacter sp. JSM 1782161]|uniref:alpha/beta fold hydrolase n=1 Tax=Marinobacter sp. JSM 1782161 TaxID=2685906 RepID=UPI0014042618|nr:alpha/beta fold hydrolase [Marinobacter sp. JSM 1782161]
MAEDIQTGEAGPILLLAHGAGAPMDSPFMAALADELAERGVQVVRFEFGYMARRREDGKKRPPPKAEKLVDEFAEKVTAYGGDSRKPVFVAGKSMGGRIASLLAASHAAPVSGCACFGYPFHPPGKPDRWRTDHFAELAVPLLVNQGTRDPFGRQEEVLAHFESSLPFAVEWLEDGEHDFKPRKASGLTQQALIAQAAERTARWINDLTT